MSRYALIELATGLVTNVIEIDESNPWVPPEGFIIVQSDTASPGWSYADNVFTAPPPVPPTPEEVLASQSAILQAATQLAAAQKTALTERIDTLNDAIELEMATPEEIAELPVRQAQLTAWKRYAVLLGRVATQEGWPPNVIWPEQPAEGMDLTISAARTIQASI